uniref:Uncharacterized protein n=1 Tax=viral metagenome TaxID=1070528 RepID=A0A6C0IRV8_9ZZZZ
MDFLTIYYYTSLPILSCNLLFYSIANLSTSITSSQNVIKFVSDHTYCDNIIFQNNINKHDLLTRLKIIQSLIYDIVKKYCNDNETKFNKIIDEIRNPDPIFSSTFIEFEDYLLVDPISKKDILETLQVIDEPVKLSIMATASIVFQISELFEKVKIKVNAYDRSFKKHFSSIHLKTEISELDNLTKLLDMRLSMLVDLLKIYMPIKSQM